MKHGFVRVAAATPTGKVADCGHNSRQIIELIRQAQEAEVKVLVLPELCITGYTCSDLFFQDTIINESLSSLWDIAKVTKGKDVLCFIGLPLLYLGKLYNVAAAVQNGKVLGFVPKLHIPNYSEFYEARHFTPGPVDVQNIVVNGEEIPFGSRMIFQAAEMEDLQIAAEICEDVWVPQPPSGGHAEAGATVIVNLSASNEITGKDSYRRELVRNQSARLVAGYIYANAGEGESTTDLVFAGHNLIAENGIVLSESERFTNTMIYTEVDIYKLRSERRRMTTFKTGRETSYKRVVYSMPQIAGRDKLPVLPLTRRIDRAPFVPGAAADRKKRCDEIISIQALGLKKRLEHTRCESAVVGISGGLDSTLALLVTRKAYDMLGWNAKGIIAVTMPCFGTTDRTYQNAVTLVRELGATLREIRIEAAVMQHFKDISHDPSLQNVVYENSQARERTQILMDIANQTYGIVVGTGDLSELALGWATYNGDHMSNYAVNASIPKTLVRYLVADFADSASSSELKRVLLDILDTPVSPELLPPKDGEIAQKTEDLVGPYELHDFVLYYVMRFGFMPEKIYYLACLAFSDTYDEETIYRWLTVFYRRFFSQQFKRSCLPDGPKVGSVALSPRGDFRMPSDACVTSWLKNLEQCKMGEEE